MRRGRRRAAEIPRERAAECVLRIIFFFFLPARAQAESKFSHTRIIEESKRAFTSPDATLGERGVPWAGCPVASSRSEQRMRRWHGEGWIGA